ncbi:MAG: lipid A biosynthesis acyltransferase [Candidatus Adiutrix sp.]|jgi:predicted LPLAT superfamily acyltransferase|nr:lipid A biosynthesis acyltransferase [Candidatus Adiutrix sp.]
MSSQWSSRSLGSRFQHQIFYRLISLFGPGPAYWLLHPVVFYYSLRPDVFGRSRPYLSRRFPGDRRLAAWRRAFRLNLEFGRVLLDRAVLGLTGTFSLEDPHNGAARLRQLSAEGRGLIILTAHAGAWQSGFGWLEGLGRPVNIVQKRQDLDVDRHFFEHRPGGPAPKIIDTARPSEALAAMSAALLAGELVCVMGDRAGPAEAFTLTVPFLGGEIRLPAAPYYLAARLSAPLAVVLTRRLGPGRVAGELRRVIRPRPASGRDLESLRPYAQDFVQVLNEFIEEEPYQFFNFYDMWLNKEKKNGPEERA